MPMVDIKTMEGRVFFFLFCIFFCFFVFVLFCFVLFFLIFLSALVYYARFRSQDLGKLDLQ